MFRSSAGIPDPSFLSPFDLLVFVIILGYCLFVLSFLWFAPSGRLAAERIRRNHGIGLPATTIACLVVGTGIWYPTIGRGSIGNEYVYTTGVLLFIGGVVAMTYAACNLPTAVRAHRTAPTDIHETDSGAVELTGRIRPVETTRAPLSGAEAVCYRVVVDEHIVDTGSDTVHIESERRPFLLDDGTGRALVRPEGADLRLETDTEVETDPDDEKPEGASRAVREVSDLDPTENKREYAEAKLEPDEVVSVFGRASRDPETTASLVIDDGGREFVIKPGDESITAGFRRIVVEGALGGLVLAFLGQVVMHTS